MDDIRARYADLDDRFIDWRDGTWHAVQMFFNDVRTEVAPNPPTFSKVDGTGAYAYVSLDAQDGLSDGERFTPHSLARSFNDEGVGFFKVAIVVDRAPNTWPKQKLLFSLAVRAASQGSYQFAMWNHETGEADGRWGDAADTKEAVFSALEQFLSQDPFNRSNRRSSIGFIEMD